MGFSLDAAERGSGDHAIPTNNVVSLFSVTAISRTGSR